MKGPSPWRVKLVKSCAGQNGADNDKLRSRVVLASISQLFAKSCYRSFVPAKLCGFLLQCTETNIQRRIYRFYFSLSPSSNENIPISSEENSRTTSPTPAENKHLDNQHLQAKQEKQKRKMKCE